MTRRAQFTDRMTPLSLWIRRKCRDSREGLSVTNVDYAIEDYHNKKLMFLEEKTRGGILGYAQSETFKIVDRLAEFAHLIKPAYDYWGFYVLTFPDDKDNICDGMTLNGFAITEPQLIDHINFKKRHCAGMWKAA